MVVESSESAGLTALDGRPPFSLEKWYLDLLCDDGTVLIVLLGQVRALGLRRARLTAELHRPDGSTIGGAARIVRIRPSGSGRSFCGGRLDASDLAWETPTLSGRLSYTPRYPAACIQDPLLRDGPRRLRWIVEVPDADVEGELHVGSRTIFVAGRGYRDYVALDLLPWRMPLRHLEWGRAVCGEHAAWWIRLRLADTVLERRWRDGSVVPWRDPPALADQRVIQKGHVADLPVLHIGWLRSVLRRLAKDPHQTRLVGRVHLGGAAGWGLAEVVRWR